MTTYKQHEFHPPQPTGEWLALEPGITEMVLNYDSQTGRRTTLQKWEPGAQNAKTSLHEYCEEIYIAEGDLRVIPRRGTAEGKSEDEVEWWEKGCYAFRKPGMLHGPFESRKGCLMFISCTPANTV